MRPSGMRGGRAARPRRRDCRRTPMDQWTFTSGPSHRPARSRTGFQRAPMPGSRCSSASTAPTNRCSRRPGGYRTSRRSERGYKVMTTLTHELQAIETRIGTLEFTHDFANGYPTDKTVEKLYDERDFQRACQAYLWSLPAVSFTAWQRGITKTLGAKNGQIVAILSLEARRGILTANATTPYYLGFADLSAGPLVMTIPPSGVQGGISDAWQRTIPGTESPGTYLVLAPGQKAPGNVAGFTVRESPTFNMFLGARLTDEDPQKAKAALAQLQMYPYAQRDNPPKADILDVGTKAWSGLP